MRKLVKALLMVMCAWLLMILEGGATLSETWAMLKSENEDKAADVLDDYVRRVCNKPVVYLFDLGKEQFLEKFKKN